jgi:hypothetical protein
MKLDVKKSSAHLKGVFKGVFLLANYFSVCKYL